MRVCREVRSVGETATEERNRHHQGRQVKQTSTIYSNRAARPRKPAAPAPETLLAAPLKGAGLVVGATTVPTAVPTGVPTGTAAGVVTPACDGAGVGVMVVVNGTTLLLGKGPSDTVTVWLGVAV